MSSRPASASRTVIPFRPIAPGKSATLLTASALSVNAPVSAEYVVTSTRQTEPVPGSAVIGSLMLRLVATT